MTETPCVLLHGLAVSHRYLMPTAERLGRRSVFAPDLPGFGLSRPPSTVLDVGHHADVVAGLIDTLVGAPVAVLGNSFGCQVAVELASQRPDLITSLILVGPTTDSTAATVTAQLVRLLRDLPYEDPRQTFILARDIRDAGPHRILATLRHAVRHDIEAALSTIGVPVLLVRGARDRIAPQRWIDRLAAITPQSQTRVLPAAHNAVTTAGPGLAAMVDDFLRTVARPSV